MSRKGQRHNLVRAVVAAALILVPGLGGTQARAEEPAAEAETADSEPWDLRGELDELPFHVGGFFDVRAGTRVTRDHHELRESLAEIRLQLDFEHEFEPSGALLKIKPDFLFDPVPERTGLDLEEGRGWLDLREANVLMMPTDWMDLKVGRQIITWGTGDLVFLNDLFPKDWQSFFSGRDVEYLKAPSDAVKVSAYGSLVNADVVYTPRFDADRYIEGNRISYWNDMLDRRDGAMIHAHERDRWLKDSEVAWRLYKMIKGYEIAVYGYHGYWKSPAGTDPATGKARFPRLASYGWSVRGAVGKGVANAEMAYYNSREDSGGDDPFVHNSELRLLLGYKRELAKNFQMGAQYYLEHKMDYSDYEGTLPAPVRAEDRNRHVLTLRLTRLLLNQNLTLSLFAFYSPSDGDAYLRPHAHYKLSDAWAVEAGANAFFGVHPHTFFGQFERNSNVYAGLRYSF